MCDSADILSRVLLLVLEENGYFSRATRGACNPNFQVPVVQKLDSAIHRINLYPVDSALLVSLILILWIVIYPVDSSIPLFVLFTETFD